MATITMHSGILYSGTFSSMGDHTVTFTSCSAVDGSALTLPKHLSQVKNGTDLEAGGDTMRFIIDRIAKVA